MSGRDDLATYAVVQDLPVPWPAYERVAAAVGDELPDGLIVHVAGPTEAGVRIIDVWESREQFDRFRRERLLPAIERVTGGQGPESAFADLRVQHAMQP